MQEQNQSKNVKVPSFASFEEMLGSPETNGSSEDGGFVRLHNVVLSLAIKLLGLYLFYLAFESLTTVFAGLYLVKNLEFDMVSLQMTQTFNNLLVAPLVKAVFYVASGFYLASDGSSLYRLLTMKRLVKE